MKDGVIVNPDKVPYEEEKVIQNPVFSWDDTGFVPYITALDSHIIATVTGGDEWSCTSALSDLKGKCYRWSQQHGKRVPAAKAAELMAETLASHCDGVGLLAGWEYGWDSDYELGPHLYHIDSLGILIKGKKLAAGSGVRIAYCASKVEDMIDIKRWMLAENPMIHFPAFPFDEKYKDWTIWSVNEAAWFAGRVTAFAATGPESREVGGFLSGMLVVPCCSLTMFCVKLEICNSIWDMLDFPFEVEVVLGECLLIRELEMIIHFSLNAHYVVGVLFAYQRIRND
ncbi:OLC1v1037334C1 [Oldenlandia corymbosa var. corymbosa]|uniref:OLC1v1037334C1 n=1 Tax=Oldenlandia corymbosa var. corymbosa TaxID=529605 RepID=A0AAV1CXB5_OLDCO|nr:OLC1v1037334C1 [Oldenlandia corymbosa var. corymbosa]